MANNKNDEDVIRRLLDERDCAWEDGDLLARSLYLYLSSIPITGITQNGPKRSSITESVPPGKRRSFPPMDKRTWSLCLALYDYMDKQAIMAGTADFFFKMKTAHNFTEDLFAFLKD